MNTLNPDQMQDLRDASLMASLETFRQHGSRAAWLFVRDCAALQHHNSALIVDYPESYIRLYDGDML